MGVFVHQHVCVCASVQTNKKKLLPTVQTFNITQTHTHMHTLSQLTTGSAG